MRARAQRPSTARPRSGHPAPRPEATRATGESPAQAQQRFYSLSRPAAAAPARALRSRQALRWVSRSVRPGARPAGAGGRWRRGRGAGGPRAGGGGALRRQADGRSERSPNGQEGPPRPRCGFRGRHHRPPRPHVRFVPPHALWSLPSPTPPQPAVPGVPRWQAPRQPIQACCPHPGSEGRSGPALGGGSGFWLVTDGVGISWDRNSRRLWPLKAA